MPGSGGTPGDLLVAGLNHGAHDSSAVLLRNGTIVAAVEQERFSRRKRAIDQPPVEALAWCLESAGVELGDLHAIGLGSDLDLLGEWLGMEPARRRVDLPLDDPDRLLPTSVFGAAPRPPLVPVRHHLAHAASAYWPSGFEEAAILVVDNRGEDRATTLAYGTPEGITVLDSYPIEHSLGLYYRIATQYAGLYSKDGNAGKLMGLASYGSPVHDVALRHTPDGPRWTGVPPATTSGRDLPPERTEQLLRYFTQQCFPHFAGLREETMAYADFAASVQRAVEETLLGLAADLHERTGSANLVVAGGVGLNCTANGRLAADTPFERVYVQPMAHDAGVALGAALEVSFRSDPRRFRPEPMRHAYWGPAYDDDEIAKVLAEFGLASQRLSPAGLTGRVAAAIAGGAIVGWHQGRAEVGPRALGARSLLGDPRTRATLVRLNHLKRREMWRPLAPSVLADQFDSYFVGTPNPFMIMAAQVRPEVRSRIPAVVHVDGSARPQAVERADNPLFAQLLAAFAVEAGVPLVVNTSLNTAGMPLANHPRESVSLLLDTDLDLLAIGGHLVTRR
ncbi:carbamoyltransferase [Plantactinospora sp. WMMB782]|uniref:carbamoyltransferase family protein n=1 Tax=Plantactinospora sp. WMMB782 TaxID=3404121 RepID=UPI003B932D8E